MKQKKLYKGKGAKYILSYIKIKPENYKCKNFKLKHESHCYILDFVSNEYHERRSKDDGGPLAQVIGDKYFTLLKVKIRENTLSIKDKLYIGDGKRDNLEILRKLQYDDLTPKAKTRLPSVLEYIVKKNEKEFVEFINNVAKSLSLNKLAIITKKDCAKLINERNKKQFKSFTDISVRTGLLNPEKIIINRIICELKYGNLKYYFFVKNV